MICAKCGSSVDDTASWCTSCGAAITPSSKTAPGEPIPEALAKSAAPAAKAASKPARTKLAHLDPGEVIDGKYTIVRVLGEGGMGVVYLARDVHTGSEVVLKSMRPELAHRADVRERTLAEGRALATIDHPNVVHLNAIVADESGLWLVMQYIDGESLDNTIQRANVEKKPIPFATALGLFRQILRGVGAAHQEGVIHRDIKPANILVRRKDGVAKVTDFGIAKPEEKAREGKGNTKGVIGSLWYMSPEQVQGQKHVDKRVDIYALGVLLFELLTGRVPFDANSSYELMRMHVEDPLPKVTAERKDCPAWIDAVLAKACAKRASDRYESCDAMLRAIDEYAGSVSSAVPSVTVDSLSARPVKPTRWGLMIPLVLVASGVVGVAGYFAMGFLRPQPASTHAHRPVTSHQAPEGSSEPGALEPKPSPEHPQSSAAPHEPKPDPTDAIVGRWKSEAGRDFEAVHVGNGVELRVVSASQFAPQDYRDGEARFILTPVDGQDRSFAVTDQIRPVPPEGSKFDPKSRTTCQEVWTDANGRPLRATYDGTRLSIDSAKIEPTISNFVQKDKLITSCSGLHSLKASRVTTVLSRSD